MNTNTNTTTTVSTPNYIKEFISKTKKDYLGYFSDYEVDKDEEAKIRKVVKSLTDQLDEVNAKYNVLLCKRYNKDFTPLDNPVVLQYDSPHSTTTLYFDPVTGVRLNEKPEGAISCLLDRKSCDIVVPAGYSFPLGCIVMRHYGVKIATNNTKANLHMYNEALVPCVVKYDEANRQDSLNKYNNAGYRRSTTVPLIPHSYMVNQHYWQEDHEYALSKLPHGYWDCLNHTNANEFLSKFYNIEGLELNLTLSQTLEYSYSSPNFEMIIRQCPASNINTIFEMGITEKKKNLWSFLGLTKPEYDKIIEHELLGKWVELDRLLNYIKGKDRLPENLKAKTIPDWIDLLIKEKRWIDDFNFYAIRSSYPPLTTLLERYCYCSYSGYRNGSFDNFPSYYTFGDFCEYAIRATVDQGFTNFEGFLGELGDYLNMARTLDAKVALYSDHLIQNHNVMSRNHKIYLDAHQEEIFKKRYEGIKKWTSKDGKFVILIPKDSEDVKREGDQMSNCVASYCKRIIDGECRIFFMRKADSEDQSYMTIEERNNALVQCRLSHNRMITNDDRAYLIEFCKKMGWECKQ